MTLGAYVGPCAHFVPAGEFCQYRHGTGPKNASPASPMEELREQAAKIVRELREQINGPWAEEPAVVAMEEAAEFISRAIPLPAPVALPQAGEVEIKEMVEQAFVAGATAVHDDWVNNPGPAPRGDPEFGESAGEYAASIDMTISTPKERCPHGYLYAGTCPRCGGQIDDAPTPTETPTAEAPDDGLMGRHRDVADKALNLLDRVGKHIVDDEVWQAVHDDAIKLRAALSTATGDEGGKA